MLKIRNIFTNVTTLLSLIFFFSGFAALAYQVAWQRILTVYYGVGAISITLIVSVYMFGVGPGSLFIQDLLETVSFLYFINTLGAAVGAIFTSYFIISFYGLDTAVYLAVCINSVLSAMIFLTKRIGVSGRKGERLLFKLQIVKYHRFVSDGT